MTVLDDLFAECSARRIRLLPTADGGLTIDAPQGALTLDLTERLKASKADILARLRFGSTFGKAIESSPAHRHTDFVWDRCYGYSPAQPVVRGGVHHKLETCPSRRPWRHVWGESYCADCWPCTDLLAIAKDENWISEPQLTHAGH